jgi:nucleoside-diphosphate-sugar epimerase
MRVFVVGASGAIGSRLVPQLVHRGHQVIGTSRSGAGAERIRALGAKPIVLDLLDPRAVRKAVRETDPDAILHQATALADLTDFKHFDRGFAQTNRLRTEGTETLLAAAREAGVRRFVAQSYASMRYERVGGAVKSEDAPLDPAPVAATRETIAAMRHLDEAVTAAGGIALRYGGFYGAVDDGMLEPIRSASWAGSSVTRAGARALPRPTRRSTGRLTQSPTGRNRVPWQPESDDAISAR